MKEKPKGKEVDLSNAFGKSPVKRIEKESRKKAAACIEIPSDDEFEKSLIHIEEDVIATRKSPRKKERAPKTPEQTNLPSKPVKQEKSPNKKKSPTKTKEAKPVVKTNGHSKSPEKRKDSVPETPPPAPKQPPSSAKKSTAKKEKPADLESSVAMDEERHERRQLQSVLFQKYKNRTSVINPGCKPIPEGRPNCFAGKVFLVTGILESLERPEAEELIKKYGGKVSSGVTKKLNFMVTGEEAGPAKLAKAEEYGVKQISEDDLLEMIASSMGGERKKPAVVEVKKESPRKKSKTPEKKKAVKGEPDAEFETFTVKKKPKLELQEEPTAGPSKPTKAEVKPELAPPTCDVKNLAWVDKYKPTTIKQIIGQQGAASNTNK